MNRFFEKLTQMAFGNSRRNVPEGPMPVAQRFNAGTDACLRLKFPALKRQAIVELSLRDSRALIFRKALRLTLLAALQVLVFSLLPCGDLSAQMVPGWPVGAPPPFAQGATFGATLRNAAQATSVQARLT